MLLDLEGDREINVHVRGQVRGKSAFRAACGNGHGGIVRMLLELEGDRRIDVHVDGRPLRDACHGGH